MEHASQTALYDIVKAMTDELRDVDRGIVWRDHGARVRVAQESNARAFFNVNLAQALEVPYVASTARLLTLQHIIVATQANLAELVNLPRAAMLLDQVYGEALPLSVRREGDVLQLPFFASAVLQRAFRPTEIPEVLAEVRDAVRPLRDRLFEIEEHVQSAGPAARRELQAMRAAFAESSPWEKILPSSELGAAIGHVVTCGRIRY
jgi:hypothetical protein